MADDANTANFFFCCCEELLGKALRRARRRVDGQGSVTAVFSWPERKEGSFPVDIKVNDTGDGLDSVEVPYEFEGFLSHAGLVIDVTTTTGESTTLRAIVLRMTDTGQIAYAEDRETEKYTSFSGTEVRLQMMSNETGLERMRAYFAKLSMMAYQIDVTTTPANDTIFFVRLKTITTGNPCLGLDREAIAACLRCKYAEVGGTFVVRPTEVQHPSLAVQWGCAISGERGPLKRGANMCIMTVFLATVLQPSATVMSCKQSLERVLGGLKWNEYGLSLPKDWEPHGDNALCCYMEGLLPGLHLNLLLNIDTLDIDTRATELRGALEAANPEALAAALGATLHQFEQADARSCFWRNKKAVTQYFVPFLAEAIQRIILQTPDELLKEECFGCFAGVEGIEEWADIGRGVETLVQGILNRKEDAQKTKRRKKEKEKKSESQAL